MSLLAAGLGVLCGGCATGIALRGETKRLEREAQRRGTYGVAEEIFVMKMADFIPKEGIDFLVHDVGVISGGKQLSPEDIASIRVILLPARLLESSEKYGKAAIAMVRRDFIAVNKISEEKDRGLKEAWQSLDEKIFGGREVVLGINKRLFYGADNSLFVESVVLHEVIHWAQETKWNPTFEKPDHSKSDMNLSHPAEQQAYGLQMLYLATKGEWSWRDIALKFCRGGKGPSGDLLKDQRAVLEFEKRELGKGLLRIWKEQVEPRIRNRNQATEAKGDCLS